MKKFTIILSTLLIVVLLSPLLSPRIKLKKSIPFSFEAIALALPEETKWQSRNPSAEEENARHTALSQSYRYLGSGGQCYAFISEDSQYVIKFFKEKSFALPYWIERFPLPFLILNLRENKLSKKQKRRIQVFSAFQNAFDHLAHETEIVYAHLEQTSHLTTRLPFVDQSGVSHHIPLDNVAFVIQKKAELAFERIDALMKNQDVAGAKNAIDQLLALNVLLHQKGYRNRDPNFKSNCGFVGDEAVIIDVGRMVSINEKSKTMRENLLKSTPRFEKYLSSNHAELLPYFRNCVEKTSE